jgi:hypothetical protein
MSIKEQIRSLFETKNELSVNDIATKLLVSKQFIHRVLKEFVSENYIQKFGSAPKTIYKLNTFYMVSEPDRDVILNTIKETFLQENFILITELGNLLEGSEAFYNWCNKRKLPFEKTVDEFMLTKEKYNNYINSNGLISGLDKLKNTKGYDEIFLDELLYLDFYAIERFGKTKLGTILHYAKQGQNLMLMKMLTNAIRLKIDTIITEYSIDVIAYVPATIKRETQLMKVLAKNLNINLPKIDILKISGIISVPQKSLNKLEERINNAENTFVVRDFPNYKNVLLIDDAVGSGSTLNQITGKIKRKNPQTTVIGLAIVGSYKGFDVISDI